FYQLLIVSARISSAIYLYSALCTLFTPSSNTALLFSKSFLPFEKLQPAAVKLPAGKSALADLFCLFIPE
ncbi:MAG: hypothetical protein Q4G00_14955, partial [Clostridia bacterium]|nr:hypothetical protein [Clostridia bacterium]